MELDHWVRGEGDGEAAGQGVQPGKGRGSATRLATPETVASPTQEPRRLPQPAIQVDTNVPPRTPGRGRGRVRTQKSPGVPEWLESPQSGVERQPTPDSTAITVPDDATDSTCSPDPKSDVQLSFSREVIARPAGKESGHHRSPGDGAPTRQTVHTGGSQGQATRGGLSQVQQPSVALDSTNTGGHSAHWECIQGTSMARPSGMQAKRNAARIRAQASGTPESMDKRAPDARGEPLPPKRMSALVATAIQDPDCLDSEQLVWLACGVVKAAARRIASAEPAANFCHMIISKEREPRFFDGLLDCCRKWFNHRLDWLPRRASEKHGGYDSPPEELWGEKPTRKGAAFQWSAFVLFQAELVAIMGDSRSSARRAPASTALMPVHFLAWQLCDCFKVMLLFPAADLRDEMEILELVLKRAGNVANQVAGSRMGLLVGHLREACDLFPHEAEPVLKKLLHLRDSLGRMHCDGLGNRNDE